MPVKEITDHVPRKLIQNPNPPKSDPSNLRTNNLLGCKQGNPTHCLPLSPTVIIPTSLSHHSKQGSAWTRKSTLALANQVEMTKTAHELFYHHNIPVNSHHPCQFGNINTQRARDFNLIQHPP
jgi:hypothetical protein